MEVIQAPAVNTKQLCTTHYRPTPRCGTARKVELCGRGRYVQPARVTSFAPQKIYKPPSKPLEAHSTYHQSYLTVDKTCHERPKPFKPSTNLKTVNEKFEDGTTSKTSYQPVWNIVKANPIVPRQRNLFAFKGPMQSSTTVRNDFGPKFVEKTELVIPCGNIRSCSGPIDGRTTAGVCYVNPGNVKPPASFKPTSNYCPPQEAILSETTQKLSYLPHRVEQKEKYPWAQKPSYKPPDTAMDGTTTYCHSFFSDGQIPEKEKPIIPNVNRDLFPVNLPMIGTSVSHECYVPQATSQVSPVIPCGNIMLSDKKMACDTTSKMSYKPVMGEVRAPIRPKQRSLLNKGPIESATTNRCDFVHKMAPRPELIIPCDNIRNSQAPLEDFTTSGASYQNPGRILPPQSFKPLFPYKKPTVNIDSATTSKLSYKAWTPAKKEDMPWARKASYQAPKEPMAGNTHYNMSYPAPGYYIEECEEVDCPASSE